MDQFFIYVDGQPVQAIMGQSIAEAMLSSGLKTCRKTKSQTPRGVFCAVGVCYECRMVVDGIPNVRTCITAAMPESKIMIQNDAGITIEEG